MVPQQQIERVIESNHWKTHYSQELECTTDNRCFEELMNEENRMKESIPNDYLYTASSRIQKHFLDYEQEWLLTESISLH